MKVKQANRPIIYLTFIISGALLSQYINLLLSLPQRLSSGICHLLKSIISCCIVAAACVA
jgi:hypothetical protein